MAPRPQIRSWRRLLTIGTVLLTMVSATGAAARAASSTRDTAPAAVAPGAAMQYEAEDATISQGEVDSDHAGFTGTGFVNYDNVTGSYVEFTVAVSTAATLTLTFRYANGTTTNRPVAVTVNSGSPSTVDFPGTGSWTSWQTRTLTVDLTPGTNTIRATATTANGGPNLDSMSVAEQVNQTLEAEDALVSQGEVDSDHAGFTGTGFVNYDNVTGSYVEFTVTTGGAATLTLTFRYANGTTTNRPVAVTVNGGSPSTVDFPGTGSWTNWQTRTLTTDLTPGTNTIRATATTAGGGPNLDSMSVTTGGGGGGGGTDWSTAVVDSTMTRYTPNTLGGWGYTTGLYLYAQYLVYQRTHNPSYLQYIRNWADRFVGGDGSIGQSFSNLDSMQAGNVLLILYQETGQSKYRIAAQKIRDRLRTYPRTSDGGFWHATSTSRQHQLWADGTFMVVPFLLHYGQIVGDTAYTQDEAAKQLVVYGSHLQTSLGILKHAYDESRTQSWADPTTGLSPEYWCRAIGWYGMAEIETLDILPASHPQRARLLTILRNLVAGYARFQDPATGRWFQVVDKGGRSDNWTETSCSAMYTFVISRAVERGWVDAGYRSVASRGYQGVLARLSRGSDGLTNLTDICIGTNVGSYSYYINRTRATNDLHGLGAFLIMNEQLTRTGG